MSLFYVCIYCFSNVLCNLLGVQKCHGVFILCLANAFVFQYILAFLTVDLRFLCFCFHGNPGQKVRFRCRNSCLGSRFLNIRSLSQMELSEHYQPSTTHADGLDLPSSDIFSIITSQPHKQFMPLPTVNYACTAGLEYLAPLTEVNVFSRGE